MATLPLFSNQKSLPQHCIAQHELGGSCMPINTSSYWQNFYIARMVIRSLKDGPIADLPLWLYELEIMEANGVKAEIEAAYKHSGYGAFTRVLARRLEEGAFIWMCIYYNFACKAKLFIFRSWQAIHIHCMHYPWWDQKYHTHNRDQVDVDL